MFSLFKKREPEQSPEEFYHGLREDGWKQFIKSCEKFDHVKFKDGRCIGYKKDEPENFGTALVIPFEMAKLRFS